MFVEPTKLEHGRRTSLLPPAPDELWAPNYLDDSALFAERGGKMVFDIECYPNYFLLVFKSLQSSKIVKFEFSPDEDIDYTKLSWVMSNFCVIGFNSNGYDIPLVCCVLRRYTIEELYQASFELINGTPPHVFKKERLLSTDGFDHIDLIEVCPLEGSLKAYAARVHCQRMQEMHLPVNAPVSKVDADKLFRYCVNDLDNTELLFNELKEQIELRETLGREYGQDLRSRSDAQMAEYVIANEVKKINGRYPKRPEIVSGSLFQYRIPNFIKYNNPVLCNALDVIRNTSFEINQMGSVDLPDAIKNLYLPIGYGVYRFGIGGLHSSEKCTKHLADDETVIRDVDVRSFYPAIILSLELFPKQMGKAFLKVYRALVKRRVDAKLAGVKAVAEGLKITVNGGFGKLMNMYSALYAPDLGIQVTITGQLSLLMLIEMVETAGGRVISANTDGIMIKSPVAIDGAIQDAIKEWQRLTTFETEETRYKAVYSRDVNSYIALKGNGKYKAKGSAYANPWDLNSGAASIFRFHKNPNRTICIEAVVAYLDQNRPLRETIEACKDFRKFVCVQTVRGGAHKNGTYLGKCVRWYYAVGTYGTINYVLSGNKVPSSDGAKPVMDLPSEFPKDIYYDWYVNEAESILYDIGAKSQPSLFS